MRDNRFAKPRLCPFSSGTSGHAPVQAFQRLHRGYSIHLVYCFREQSASVWRGWRRLAHRSLPHRGTYDQLSPIETELCAVERTEQISADPLLRGVCEPRSPHGSKPTNWPLPRPTDRHFFSRCQWAEITTGGGDNSHSLFSPRHIYRKRKARSSIVEKNLNFCLALL